MGLSPPLVTNVRATQEKVLIPTKLSSVISLGSSNTHAGKSSCGILQKKNNKQLTSKPEQHTSSIF